MNSEPLIHWPDPLLELIGFVAVFLAAGAVGFRFAALSRVLATGAEPELGFARNAARRAAWMGMAGALTSAVLLIQRLPGMAARRHVGIAELITSQPPLELQIGLLVLALAGFALAAAGRDAGWWLAALGVIVSPFRSAFFGQLARVVKPGHELAGGLWIGTLFVMVVLGIVPALRSALDRERRAALVARMVSGFSPFALAAAGLLATLGVTAAFRSFKRVDQLWSTPYGYALIAKLVVVASVLAFGAWNWRRQRPRLGTEDGAISLRRSATVELVLAGVVLLITSVLVSLPTPE